MRITLGESKIGIKVMKGAGILQRLQENSRIAIHFILKFSFLLLRNIYIYLNKSKAQFISRTNGNQKSTGKLALSFIR